jgi:F0F1-type ATP synthase assembly protein I
MQLIVRAFIKAFTLGGPVALGYVSNDFISWLGQLPLVGSFFQKKDAQGSTPWYVNVVAVVGVLTVVLIVLKKVFKIKIL